MYVDPFYFGLGTGFVLGILGTLIFALLISKKR